MNVSSKIMAMTMTAMLMAMPAFAAGTSGSMSSGSSMNSGTTGINSSTGVNNQGVNSNSSLTGSNMNSSAGVGSPVSDVNSNSDVNRTTRSSRAGLAGCSNGKCNLSLTSLDLNSNGSISLREFRKAKLSKGLFRKIDKNHNGIISQTELNAYNKKHMGSGLNRVPRTR